VSYLVMEYVEGITLRERIAQGPIPPPQVASIAVDLAEALHVAHSAGIVHRDIKPSNVLLWKSPLPGREWRAKLADFGIAHLLDSARVTTPGMIIGTVAYVAPEQARGDAPAPPADIYALGLLLMEALTGERPFADAEGIGAVMARLAAPPEVPGSLEPEWRGLLRGMTAMRPEDRPSALEVAITAERLALGEAPLPASLADEPTQQAAILDTGPTRLLPAAAAVEGGVTAPIPPPLPPAVPPEGAVPTAAPPASDDRRPRTRLIAIIVAALLVIGVATAALWWSAQMGADGSEPQPSPSVVDTPAPQPSETPADTPAPAEEDGAGDDGGAGTDTGTGTGNDNSGPGNNNGNGNGGGNSGNGDGGGNGNGP
ncbi:MAG: protein kinase domain-containing protein, partial [Microbacterium sp.]